MPPTFGKRAKNKNKRPQKKPVIKTIMEVMGDEGLSFCLICGIPVPFDDSIWGSDHGAKFVEEAFKKICKYLLKTTTAPFPYPYTFCPHCIPEVQYIISLNKKISEMEQKIEEKVYEIGNSINGSAKRLHVGERNTTFWKHFRQPISNNYKEGKLPKACSVILERNSVTGQASEDKPHSRNKQGLKHKMKPQNGKCSQAERTIDHFLLGDESIISEGELESDYITSSDDEDLFIPIIKQGKKLIEPVEDSDDDLFRPIIKLKKRVKKSVPFDAGGNSKSNPLLPIIPKKNANKCVPNNMMDLGNEGASEDSDDDLFTAIIPSKRRLR